MNSSGIPSRPLIFKDNTSHSEPWFMFCRSSEGQPTYRHTLRPRTSACLQRSCSTCPCEGRTRPARCMPLRFVGRSSCSSHSRPGRRSPRGRSKVSAHTYMATGRTDASQPRAAMYEGPSGPRASEHYWESVVKEAKTRHVVTIFYTHADVCVSNKMSADFSFACH